MQDARYRRAVKIAADENLLPNGTDGVHINCSVAGVVVLIMAAGGQLPVQLAVGALSLPYSIKGYTATGSSGTFTVSGLYA